MSPSVCLLDMVLICSVLSAFFRHGKVIETARGDGISQVAIDFTIERLDEGEWVSAFLQYGGHHPTISGTRISARIRSSGPTRTATRPTEVGHVSTRRPDSDWNSADHPQRENSDGGQISSNNHSYVDKRYMDPSPIHPNSSLAHQGLRG